MSTLFVLKEGHKWGPFTTEELGSRVEKGVFTLDDLFWTAGMEDWQPIETVIERVEMAVIEEAPGESLYENDDILVTSRDIQVPGETIPIRHVLRASAQKEPVHRVGPAIGSIVLGVAIVCLALVEFPRSTTTHWVLWGMVLLGLLAWWVRMMYSALRAARCHVTVDLHGDDERILHADCHTAGPIAEAINRAVEMTTGVHPSHKPHHPDVSPEDRGAGTTEADT